MGNRSALSQFRRAPRERARGLKAVVLAMVALGVATFAASISQAASPVRILSTQTGDFGNGKLDHIRVTFSSAMVNDATSLQKSSGPGAPGFEVTGYDIDRFEWVAANGTPRTTLLIHVVEKSQPDTDATPLVTYRSGGGGAVAELTSQEADDFNTDPTATVATLDRAGPVLLSFDVNDQNAASPNIFNHADDEAWLTFSEPAVLAGLTPRDRFIAIEKAVKFTNEPGSVGCQGDGTGALDKYNFPQPKGDTAADDPIKAPLPGAAAEVFRIKQGAAQGSFYKVIATPQLCWAGIDSAVGGAANIADAAGNAASAINALDNRKVWINPVDATLLTAETLDNLGAANGLLDGIKLTFDQRLDDATLANNLNDVTVAFGEEVATIDPVLDTGATANDQTAFIRFTGVSWHSGIRPTISYTKPAGCTPTAGTAGVKAIVPTGGTWRACVGAFSVQALDKAAPVVLGARTADVAGGAANGKLDRLSLSFSETVNTPTGAGWKVNGIDAAATRDGTNDKMVHLDFAEGTTPDTDALPAYSYTAQAAGGGAGTTDLGANQVAARTYAATIDAAAPRIVEASVFDANNDAKLDRLEVIFSEPIEEPAESALGGFSVGGSSGVRYGSPAGADVPGDEILAIEIMQLNGTAARDVAYTPAGSIEDAARNAATAQTIATALVKDLAKPHATITVSPSAPLSAGQSQVTATFSEGMLTTAAPTATLGTLTISPVVDADHNEFGWRTADPSKWDGTVTIGSNDCAVATGCAVDVTIDGATDPRANAQRTATFATEIDTMKPQAPALIGFSTTLEDGQTVPAGMMNMFTRSLQVDATIAADAGKGKASIIVDGTNEIGLDDQIAESDTAIAPAKTFADAEALRAAFTDGSHTLGVKVCDDANNCEVSASTLDVTVDATPVTVDLTAPSGTGVVAGGSELTITWDAGDEADFDHVELDYSTTGGESYAHQIDHAQTARDGSYTWTTPSIEETDVKVRAVTVDAAGNKSFSGMADAFAIDSAAPSVELTAPTASEPFLPAGGTATIRWDATDATMDRVENPITIEYSLDGETWLPINGGEYSKADDGQEVWQVPAGRGFSNRVRVSAVDATDKTTTALSDKLARGVAGYTVADRGSVYSFGTAEAKTNESLTQSKSWVRGMAIRPDGKAGYVLSTHGSLFPFSTGDNAKPSKPRTTKFSGDYARGVVLRTNTSGYVLHSTGRLYPFGGAPKVRLSTVLSSKAAKSVVMLANKRGGYVLDGYGRMWPFAVGSYSMPPKIQSKTLWSTQKAVDVVLRSGDRSGYILERSGNVRAFGGAPSVDEVGESSTKVAVAIVKVGEGAGYWMDNRGRLYAWGAAFGNPTVTPFSSSYARGAAAL